VVNNKIQGGIIYNCSVGCAAKAGLRNQPYGNAFYVQQMTVMDSETCKVASLGIAISYQENEWQSYLFQQVFFSLD
jgi:hypothetical protein